MKPPPWGWLVAGVICRDGLVVLLEGELGDE